MYSLTLLTFTTSTTVSTVCDTSTNFNQGCGSRFQSPASFGKDFNDNHGGWYVMQKSSTVGIKVNHFQSILAEFLLAVGVVLVEVLALGTTRHPSWLSLGQAIRVMGYSRRLFPP